MVPEKSPSRMNPPNRVTPKSWHQEIEQLELMNHGSRHDGCHHRKKHEEEGKPMTNWCQKRCARAGGQIRKLVLCGSSTYRFQSRQATHFQPQVSAVRAIEIDPVSVTSRYEAPGVAQRASQVKLSTRQQDPLNCAECPDDKPPDNRQNCRPDDWRTFRQNPSDDDRWKHEIGAEAKPVPCSCVHHALQTSTQVCPLRSGRKGEVVMAQ